MTDQAQTTNYFSPLLERYAKSQAESGKDVQAVAFDNEPARAIAVSSVGVPGILLAVPTHDGMILTICVVGLISDVTGELMESVKGEEGE